MPQITELFLDDKMIEMAASVVRRIHRPSKHPQNPVIHCDKWWEGNQNRPLAALYDEEEKCFKMWLRSGWDGAGVLDKAIDGYVAYTTYLTSEDGVHWNKPALGAMEFGGRRDHNVICVGDYNEEFSKFNTQGKKGFITSIMRNPCAKDESQKYVALFYYVGPRRGIYLGFSADGIYWQFENEPFWRTSTDYASWGDDAFTHLSYDKEIKKWVMYRRVIPEESENMRGSVSDRDWKPVDRYFRVWARAQSDNLKEGWSDYKIVLSRDSDDPPDTETYNLNCQRYEQVHVGYLNMYHMRPGSWHLDVQLVTSRNGIDFTRVCRREPFIPSGPHGYYNNGWVDYDVFLGCQAEPLIKDNTVFIYYQGMNRNHGKGRYECGVTYEGGTTGLVTFNRDRFVSLETGLPGPCRLVTKPIKLYPKLFLNAATWGQGEIRTEILTRDWQVIPGFSKEECAAIHGNDLNHAARWKDNQDLGKLIGKEVRIRFCMKDAGIHAFTLTTEDLKSKPVGDRDPDEAAWKPGFDLVGAV